MDTEDFLDDLIRANTTKSDLNAHFVIFALLLPWQQCLAVTRKTFHSLIYKPSQYGENVVLKCCERSFTFNSTRGPLGIVLRSSGT